MCLQHLIWCSCGHGEFLPIETCAQARAVGICHVVVYGDHRAVVEGACSYCLIGGPSSCSGQSSGAGKSSSLHGQEGYSGRKEGQGDGVMGGQTRGEKKGGVFPERGSRAREWIEERARREEEMKGLQHCSGVQARSAEGVVAGGVEMGERGEDGWGKGEDLGPREVGCGGWGKGDTGNAGGEIMGIDVAATTEGEGMDDVFFHLDPSDILSWDDVLNTDFSQGFDLSEEMRGFE